MESYWFSKLDQFTNWTGQSADHITSGFDPSWSAQGFASQAAQTAAFASAISAAAANSPGEYVDFALNPSGTVANPLIDFQMPSCWALPSSTAKTPSPTRQTRSARRSPSM